MNKTGEDWAEKKNVGQVIKMRRSCQVVAPLPSTFTKLEDEAPETENEIPDTENSKIKHPKLKREIVMVVYRSINLFGHNFEIGLSNNIIIKQSLKRKHPSLKYVVFREVLHRNKKVLKTKN